MLKWGRRRGGFALSPSSRQNLPMRPILATILALLLLCSSFTLHAAAPATQPSDFPLTPDSQRKAGVPQGKITAHQWNTSKIFPGTQRDYWIYVPAQYDPATPGGACVMIFQDGANFRRTD